ncbi:MAG TPA: IPT/TIG domain-containing protein [Bryobacteraceae bacterium]|nr:IPT/TIG domain-containing protein [Bryobacteraceae bacterium]
MNSASWGSPVAPGGLVSIFGSNLAETTAQASAPLPFTLGGTSVTVNGVPAALSFVSPAQINAQVPQEVTAPVDAVVSATVVVTTAAGSSAPAQIALAAASPGLFSLDGSGCGQAAALNTTPSGVSVNGPANAAAPGDSVTLFGTGFGLWSIQPPDGVAAASPEGNGLAGVTIDGQAVTPSYAGPAPTLVGVEQLNFQIPAGTRNGCAVPVRAFETLSSPQLTIAVESGRGQCVDPPIQSYGQIYLTESTLYVAGGRQITASFGAMFPAGPALRPPAAAQIVMAPSYTAGVNAPGAVLISPVPINIPTCPVPGYSYLSAGTIAVQGQVPGAVVTAAPASAGEMGVTYSTTLPAGFLGPGTYTISGTRGSAVGLAGAAVTLGSPIQPQSLFPAGSTISASRPLTLTWTGGDANSLVKLTLISGGTESYTYTPATAGTITMTPFCTGGVPAGLFPPTCSFGIPPSSNAEILLEVVPVPVTTVQASGVTGPVQLNWEYSYVFPGLTLGD